MQSHICHVRTTYRRLPLGGKLSRQRLMRGDKSALSIGMYLSPQTARPAYRSARPPAKQARSRTLQQVRTSPTNEKLPHRTPPLQKAKQIIAHVMAGFCGEVLGERGRFGGREPPLRKRGFSPSEVFPCASHPQNERDSRTLPKIRTSPITKKLPPCPRHS